jgi:hypothetical protein
MQHTDIGLDASRDLDDILTTNKELEATQDLLSQLLSPYVTAASTPARYSSIFLNAYEISTGLGLTFNNVQA